MSDLLNADYSDQIIEGFTEIAGGYHDDVSEGLRKPNVAIKLYQIVS